MTISFNGGITLSNIRSFIRPPVDRSTWEDYTPLQTTDSQSVSVNTVDVSPTEWWIGCNSGYAFLSTDNGASWTEQDRGLGNTGSTKNIRNIHYSTNGTFLATCASGPITRKVGNGNWEVCSDNAGGVINGRCIATDHVGTWIVGGDLGKYYRSDDNGASFTQFTIAGSTEYLTAAHTDGNGNWTLGAKLSKVYRSSDDGLSFSLNPADVGLSGTDGNRTIDRATRGSESKVILLSTVYAPTSHDGGATWIQQPADLGGQAVLGSSPGFKCGHVNGNEILLLSSLNGIFHSSDGGSSYSVYNTSPISSPKQIAFSASANKYIMVGSGGYAIS